LSGGQKQVSRSFTSSRKILITTESFLTW
jgi:hypothetical protein